MKRYLWAGWQNRVFSLIVSFRAVDLDPLIFPSGSGSAKINTDPQPCCFCREFVLVVGTTGSGKSATVAKYTGQVVREGDSQSAGSASST